MNWPDNADGDVFRRLQASGFDFEASYDVDYNVDFDSWPPAQEAVEALCAIHKSVRVMEPDDHGRGYILFQVYGPVTYKNVIATQRDTSEMMAKFGGICESWGVMHE